MNCLCHLFDDSTLWVIIIAVILLALFCNGGYNYCGNTANNGCGGCGCGCGSEHKLTRLSAFGQIAFFGALC